MTWVKVCGITTPDAAAAVVQSGADACGFVLAPGSPRTITPAYAAGLMSDVDAERYIVLVDVTVDEALELADRTGADGIQAYGPHALAVARRAVREGYKVLYPLRVAASEVTAEVGAVEPELMPILDAYDASTHGGTGRVFDWSLIGDPGRPFVLAGGLGPRNVGAAIRAVRPYGVDASSGLEKRPGVKDPSRIIDFVQEARRA